MQIPDRALGLNWENNGNIAEDVLIALPVIIAQHNLSAARHRRLASI
jgi:hypothetical protein